ncbi:DNA mismatch repair protein MutS [Porphyromonas crevioricanis JCM 15906]|uniref:DNA mismatch repair protein MutS n=2 Tax=Porphyromonas crevioricanis TaxID=393921 RepID=A0A2X4PM42_9PORP|nr:DNA mismatch repair protein MutS [Porphyromonas crevioricanis]GAD06128.1 DNA mismatch repair protein MutS [Porphyromonas crevioricanis JCM 15906]GAD06412.1 DNA mismatch repair protein MutS [Porphyromonas crevioricanis JCM 13913]SJZ57656.1 DNA mismatch repair protein MutS [Porphyromonas crevioricanis]SQH73425.1 DNA mismatch repair protein mutS [Porphyromonas crevioricanis]
MAKKVAETPLMKQYLQMKAKHPDAILLFRVGDFYETFSTDAIVTADILGITLTKRANGSASHVELAGFPHHALDTYLPKLVRAGKRVAICDQLEDPKTTKTLVKRGITELVTPGVVMNDNVLHNKENNYLSAIYALAPHGYGIAFLDISTGEFMAGQGNATFVDRLLMDFAPKELLVERSQREQIMMNFKPSTFIYDLDDWLFGPENNEERICRHFGLKNLKGLGLEGKIPATIAAGAILNYLDLTSHKELEHISSLRQLNEQEYVRLDRFTIRSLELISANDPSGISLLNILDRTVCPMGGRLLRKWLLSPLKNIEAITRRQSMVTDLVEQPERRQILRTHLSEIGDLERLVGKAAVGRISPREMLQVGLALDSIAPIQEELLRSSQITSQEMGQALELLPELGDEIRKSIVPDAPIAVGRGKVIADGISSELDELRALAGSGKNYLSELVKQEIQTTGISSLKIGYNNVFGYYIEVRNAHKDKVPDNWIRKQTLVNAERYITEELKSYEEKILGAEERSLIIETELFTQLVGKLTRYIKPLQKNCRLLAESDVLSSFAEVASAYSYTCPKLHNGYSLHITAGRHPVIERTLPASEPYIPNDIYLDNEKQQIAIITGPNMSGKSALLRQTALITLLAQIGSYVPAKSAEIGVIDSLFTRVGASDNISMGESTFMVEMQEAAGILNNITDRSLVLFDELGRGTSTYDGISIAWAIVEYLHGTNNGRAKTLFATHYHELGDLEKQLSRVVNYNVSAREVNGKMLFLRTLVPGCAEHSFGIQVARLAGMPKPITERAEDILRILESDQSAIETKVDGAKMVHRDHSHNKKEGAYQLSFFQLEDPLLSDIRRELLDIDINTLTPIDALNKLDAVQRLLRGH